MMNERRLRIIVGLLAGLGLIGLGVLFLLMQFLQINLGAFWPFGFRFWDLLWPFIIIGLGVLFFVGMILGGRSMASLAIPGSMITTVGLILFLQNTFGHWASWAYAWALIFPTSLGVGYMIYGAWSGHRNTVRSGIQLAQIGLLIFLVAGFFFEVVLNISGSPLMRILWPLLLIAAGAYLMLRILLRPSRSPLEVEAGGRDKPSMGAPDDSDPWPPA